MSTLTTLNTDNPFTLPISASNYRSFTLDFNFDGRILAGLQTCGVKLDHTIVPPIVGEEGSHREILDLTTVQSTIAKEYLEDTPFTLSELCFIARSRLPLLTVDSLAHAINTLISEAYTNTTPSTQTSSLSPSQLRQLFTKSLLEPPTRTTPFAPSALFARRPRPHVPHAAFTLQAPLSLSTPPELPRIFCAAPQALQEMGLSPALVSQHIFDEAPASTTATASSAAQPSQRTSEDLAAPSKALAALLAGHNPGFTLCAAHRYCGHQFGVWASQLGDGAAMTVAMLAMPTKDVDNINMGDDNLDNVSHADALVSSLTPTVASAILSSSSESSQKVLNSLDAPTLQKLSSTVAAGLAPHALLYPMNMLIPVKTVVDNNDNPSEAVKNDLCINDAHSAPYLDAHFKRWLRSLTSTPNNASPSTSTPSTPSPPTPASLPTILHPTRPKALPLELQYKGSGLTTFSRSADGRKVLRSSLREHIGSASMHALGVPTTQSPSLAIGQDAVMRDQFYRGQPKMESCAVITRTAPTFLRIGSLETGRLRDGVKHVAVPRSLLGDKAGESGSAAEADVSSTSRDGVRSVMDAKSGLKSTLPLTSATGPIETLCYLLAAVYTDIVDDYVANFWRLHSEKDAGEAVHSVYWDEDAGKPRNLPQQLHEHLLSSLNGEFIPTSTPTWPRPRQYVPAPPITDNPIPASIQATLPLSAWSTNPLWQQWRAHSSSELQQPPVPLTLWDWRAMVMQVAARVAVKTGALTAQWQSVGYVHGVLNTDNISLAGVTIDYGPFGINHQFDFFRIPNTSDSEGRYRYSEQRAINLWNMGKLREALMSTPLPIEAIEKHSWSKLSGSCDTTAEAKIWLLEQVAQQDPKFPPVVDPAADNFYNLEEAPEEGWLGPLVQIPENYLTSVYEQSYESVEAHLWAGKLGLRSAGDVAVNDEFIPRSENIPNSILHAVSTAQGSLGFMSNPNAEQSGFDKATPFNPTFTAPEKHFQELSGIPNPRFQTLQSLAMWSEHFRDVCRQGLVSDNTSASTRDSSAYDHDSLRNVDTPLSPSLLAMTNALIEEINATHGHYTRQNIPPTSSSLLSTSNLTTAMITAIDRALVLLLQLTMHIAGSEAPLALRHIAEQSSMLSEWGQSMLQFGRTENSEMFSRLNTTLDELVKLGLRSGELRGLAQSLIPSESKEELEEMREKLQELLVLRPQLKEAVLAKLREVDSVMLRWRIYDSYGPVVSSEDNSILGAPVCSLRGKVVKNADDNASTSTSAAALTGTSYRNDKAARDRALWTEWLRLYAMRLAVDEISLYNRYTASTNRYTASASSPSHASANNSDAQPQDIIPFDVFVDVYRSLRSSSQRSHTPVHLPRNVLLEEAIRAAEEENDDVCVRALLTVLSDPYDLGLCDIKASAKQQSGEALSLVAGALSPCPDIYRDFSRDIFRAWVSHFREELRKRSTKSDYEICVSCSS